MSAVGPSHPVCLDELIYHIYLCKPAPISSCVFYLLQVSERKKNPTFIRNPFQEIGVLSFINTITTAA